MHLKKFIYNLLNSILLNRNYHLKKYSETNNVISFIKRFKENIVPLELTRYGSDNDGGYLLPEILHKIKYCFSPGVGPTSSFEKDIFIKHNIKSFLLDATVNKENVDTTIFDFDSLLLGNRTFDNKITLYDWVSNKVKPNEDNLLLQMDIEGSEYDVLIETSEIFLQRFACIIIEFHNLLDLFEKSGFRLINSTFEKIYKAFAISHVHVNNGGQFKVIDKIGIPSTLEVTFVNRKILKDIPLQKNFKLPHNLDKKNCSDLKDMPLPRYWWDVNSDFDL